MSLPIAAVAGFVVAGCVFVVFYQLFTKVQASSETRIAEVIGLPGEVTVPIAVGSVGEIAYICRGARMIAPGPCGGRRQPSLATPPSASSAASAPRST